MLPTFLPLPLRRLKAPFDHPDWLYELKIDGFRAVAHIEPDRVRLISRAGILFTRFKPLAAAIGSELAGRTLVLDGEVACLDGDGKSVFDDLFYRRGTPIFAAFDVMRIDDIDVTERPLRERKALLRELIPTTSSSMLYVDHLEERGAALFAEACRRDLEGIVAKLGTAPYRLLRGESSWVKIKNPNYTQAVERHEKFARRRR